MENALYLDQQTTLVRQRAQEVFERYGQLVAVDPQRYQALLAELDHRSRQPASDSLSGFDQHVSPERRLGLNLFFGVVNYCFVQPYTRIEYPYTSKNGALIHRATGFYAALAESDLEWDQIAAIEGVPLARWHAALQTDREADLFQLDIRLERLRQFSTYLAGRSVRRAGDLFARFQDAGSLLKLLVKSGLFEDELLKRAQLTVYMLNPSSVEITGRPIPGLDRFTVMADYRLPQVLYNQGTLKILDPRLLERLRSHQVFERDRDYERALRAATVVIGQRLAGDLQMAEADLDHLLWELSQVWVNAGKMSIPHMLVPTDKY